MMEPPSRKIEPPSPSLESADASEAILPVYDIIQEKQGEAFNFLVERGVEFPIKITPEQYASAEDLGAGVSGAKKILYQGETYVIKPQTFSGTFKKNYETLLHLKKPIENRLVNESDDSFYHFPRKEKLGYLISQAFSLETPETDLVQIEGKQIASLQKFIPKEKARPMIEQTDVEAYEIEFESAIRTLLFHMVTENIDGHIGNILLVDFEGEDEDDLVNYQSVPIDYGLIFPRHDSIYPQEFNLIKKGFFKLFEGKTINVNKHLKPLNLRAAIEKSKDIRQLASEREYQLLLRNIRALEMIIEKGTEKITISDLFDEFIKNITILGEI